ncbi:unnamed protein product [Allacma fusca]|uniref:Uncharacterized protein n=1 Tax=Allacma fusca TaxID=39272 RepID=A0A8J2NWC3_9HEXA|nr:unnamed protein product [Allacma fusca]
MTKRLTDMEKTFTGRMEELEARIDDMEEESSSLKSQIMALQEENQELRKKVEINELKSDRLARKNNLMFYGLPEGEQETRGKLHENLNKFIPEALEVGGIYIDDAYRTGTYKKRQHRAVKV